MAAKHVTLHGAWFSPWVMRVRVALEMKDVHYTYIEEDLTNKSLRLRELNPVHQKVPVLVHKGSPIIESSVILEYIEKEWNDGPSFLPRDPIRKEQARYWAKYLDGKFKDAVWTACFGKGKEKEDAIINTKEALDVLEKEIEGKTFFGGDSIGLVDVTANYMGYYFPIMQEVVGLQIWTQAQYPNLTNWAEVFCKDSSVKKHSPDKKRLVKFFKKYMDTGILYHPKGSSDADTDEDT